MTQVEVKRELIVPEDWTLTARIPKKKRERKREREREKGEKIGRLV